mmetsp:Transcript_5791/g.14308  ORF Transcript_5791/g.14308 Transcript_5791/m.14308 type:complete len:225 (+) Transcript_5791:895-1569(+)
MGVGVEEPLLEDASGLHSEQAIDHLVHVHGPGAARVGNRGPDPADAPIVEERNRVAYPVSGIQRESIGPQLPLARDHSLDLHLAHGPEALHHLLRRAPLARGQLLHLLHRPAVHGPAAQPLHDEHVLGDEAAAARQRLALRVLLVEGQRHHHIRHVTQPVVGLALKACLSTIVELGGKGLLQLQQDVHVVWCQHLRQAHRQVDIDVELPLGVGILHLDHGIGAI